LITALLKVHSHLGFLQLTECRVPTFCLQGDARERTLNRPTSKGCRSWPTLLHQLLKPIRSDWSWPWRPLPAPSACTAGTWLESWSASDRTIGI
jgi:hypothetical protein